MIGGGFVGTTTATVFAEKGHDVHLVESDADRHHLLGQGTIPFHEPGLQEAFAQQVAARRLRIQRSIAELPETDLLYLAVGTPQDGDGSADLGQVKAATEQIGHRLAHQEGQGIVVVKSTVPPGTTQEVVAPILDAALGERPYGLAMVPEFLAEGRALADAREPSRVVVGAREERTARLITDLHADTACPLLIVDPTTAELVKYGANALLATKIAFTNEMAHLAERLGTDIDAVMQGVGLDPRIGPHFLDAGLGFGGSCFPKDLAALRATARRKGTPLTLLDAVLAQNEAQPGWAVEAARELLGDLRGARVAILGLAFKPGTSDVRESRALPIARALRHGGAEVVGHDPIAAESFRAYAGNGIQTSSDLDAVIQGADAIILHTAWPEYGQLDPHRLIRRMRGTAVIDGRRVLPADAFRAAGFTYRALGNGTEAHESRHPRRRVRHPVPTSH